MTILSDPSARRRQAAIPMPRLRLARADDKSGIIALARSTDEYLDVHTDYTYWLLLRHLSDHVIVAETESGDLVGFLSSVKSRTTPRSLFLWQIAVESAYRHSGLGRALMDRLLCEVDDGGWECFEVSIAPDNDLGFKVFNSWAVAHGMDVVQVGDLNYTYFNGTPHKEIIYQARMPGYVPAGDDRG